jgi:hypothetical protein
MAHLEINILKYYLLEHNNCWGLNEQNGERKRKREEEDGKKCAQNIIYS